MGTVWVHARFRLVDLEHKKPDRRKAITFSIATPIVEIEANLKTIEKLISDGYVIERMWVTSG